MEKGLINVLSAELKSEPETQSMNEIHINSFLQKQRLPNPNVFDRKHFSTHKSDHLCGG